MSWGTGVFILVSGGCLEVRCLISRVISLALSLSLCMCVWCVRAPAYRSAVCDNEMLHVAKRHQEGESRLFFIRIMFHWVHRLFILFRDTKTWWQILIKRAHCASLPGNTPAFCLVNHCEPQGRKILFIQTNFNHYKNWLGAIPENGPLSWKTQ